MIVESEIVKTLKRENDYLRRYLPPQDSLSQQNSIAHTPKKARVTNPPSTFIDSSYTATNQRSRYLEISGYNRLLNSISDIETQPRRFFNVLSVVQSTGYGKTKACIDLMCHRKVVYFPCTCSIDHIRPAAIIQDMLSKLRHSCDMDSEDTKHTRKTLDKIVYSIQMAAAEFKDNSNEEFQAAQFQSGDYYKSLEQYWAKYSTHTPEKLKVHFESNNMDSNGESSAESSASSSASSEALIIVFDEANALNKMQKKVSQEHSCTRILSRILNRIKKVGEMPTTIGIFLGTSSKIFHLQPGHDGSRTSIDQDERCDYPAITNIAFPDLFQKHFLLLGRPLWHSIASSLNGSMQRALNKAAQLLFNFANMHDSSEHDARWQNILVLFLVRFALLPNETIAENCMANHLGTVLELKKNLKENNRNSHTVTVRYLSEPILAEVAARVTCSLENATVWKCSLLEALSTLHNTLRSGFERYFVEQHKGDVGELVSSIALAITADRLRVRKYQDESPLNKDINQQLLISDQADADHTYDVDLMSKPISAVEFLRSVCNLADDFDFKDLKQYEICFTHFIKNSVTGADQTVIGKLYERRAAVLLAKLAKGVDSLIIMKRKDETETAHEDNPKVFGIISIQIKNYATQLSKHNVVNLQQDCGPSLYSDFISDWLHPSLIVSLVIAVGGESVALKGLEPNCVWVDWPRATRSRTTTYSSLCLSADLSCFNLLDESERRELYSIATTRQEIPKKSYQLSQLISEEIDPIIQLRIANHQTF